MEGDWRSLCRWPVPWVVPEVERRGEVGTELRLRLASVSGAWLTCETPPSPRGLNGLDGAGGESGFREERFGSPPENFFAFHIFLVGCGDVSWWTEPRSGSGGGFAIRAMRPVFGRISGKQGGEGRRGGGLVLGDRGQLCLGDGFEAATSLVSTKAGVDAEDSFRATSSPNLG